MSKVRPGLCPIGANFSMPHRCAAGLPEFVVGAGARRCGAPMLWLRRIEF